MLCVKMIHIRIEYIHNVHNSNPLHVLQDPVWFITIENAARWTDKIYCRQKKNTVVKNSFTRYFFLVFLAFFRAVLKEQL